MFLKPLLKSKELIVYRILNSRMNLTSKDMSQYLTLQKGYEGEKDFNSLLEKLPITFLILNDLLLEKNNTFFQIDTLQIYQNTIYLFEVKNYEGDFYVEEDRWYSVATGKEIQNPLTQLSRCSSLFRRYLQDIGISNLSVKELLIFINPEFTLLQAPRNKPIILPTQLNRFISDLNSIPSQLSDFHYKLAAKINSDHVVENPYKQLPEYEYAQLKKGVICKSCYSFMSKLSNTELICRKCGFKELLEASVMRSVEEFSVLFPEIKITSKIIHEWCNINSIRTIRRILKKNMTQYYLGRYSYYTFPTQK
ncbi:nuclease-related domain-containing protein [Lederbergia citri]|uniref:NERD domain-containing protein n=1 Tax=Lederbergia citri TaxID=2833580 RepID=A0A942TFM2_9BACI|nr:nuclease-related domain-containing protein [Lederbergia citri]MBS4195886.1 NERD domain-containing protein [Lederbergia citri]